MQIQHKNKQQANKKNTITNTLQTITNQNKNQASTKLTWQSENIRTYRLLKLTGSRQYHNTSWQTVPQKRMLTKYEYQYALIEESIVLSDNEWDLK